MGHSCHMLPWFVVCLKFAHCCGHVRPCAATKWPASGQRPRLNGLKSCTVVGGTPSSEQKEHLQEGRESGRALLLRDVSSLRLSRLITDSTPASATSMVTAQETWCSCYSSHIMYHSRYLRCPFLLPGISTCFNTYFNIFQYISTSKRCHGCRLSRHDFPVPSCLLQGKNDIVVATPGRFMTALGEEWVMLNRATQGNTVLMLATKDAAHAALCLKDGGANNVPTARRREILWGQHKVSWRFFQTSACSLVSSLPGFLFV